MRRLHKLILTATVLAVIGGVVAAVILLTKPRGGPSPAPSPIPPFVPDPALKSVMTVGTPHKAERYDLAIPVEFSVPPPMFAIFQGTLDCVQSPESGSCFIGMQVQIEIQAGVKQQTLIAANALEFMGLNPKPGKYVLKLSSSASAMNSYGQWASKGNDVTFTIDPAHS